MLAQRQTDTNALGVPDRVPSSIQPPVSCDATIRIEGPRGIQHHISMSGGGWYRAILPGMWDWCEPFIEWIFDECWDHLTIEDLLMS